MIEGSSTMPSCLIWLVADNVQAHVLTLKADSCKIYQKRKAIICSIPIKVKPDQLSDIRKSTIF